MASSSNRQCHYIRANHGISTPTNLMFVDCWLEKRSLCNELCQQVYSLKKGRLIHVRLERERATRQSFHSFSSGDDLFGHINNYARHNKSLYIIGRNPAVTFSVCELGARIAAGEFTVRQGPKGNGKDKCNVSTDNRQSDVFYCCSDTAYIIPGKYLGRNVTLLGWENFFSQIMSDCADSCRIVLPKEPEHDSTAEAIDSYLLASTQTMLAVFRKYLSFLRSNNLGMFAFTLAGQSFRAFRHRFMEHKILVHSNADILRVERKAYVGGRISHWYQGKLSQPLYELDVRGLFPYAMMNGMLPSRLERVINAPRLSDFPKEIDPSRCIAAVRLKADRRDYPLKEAGKVHFYHGCFDTYLCGPEFRLALSLNQVDSVAQVIVYRCEPIFREFVRFFWSKRREYEDAYDTVMAGVMKQFCNSLYGKFGQHSTFWENREDVINANDEGEWVSYNVDSGQIKTYRSLFGKVQEKMGEQETANSCPAISAFVTSYARTHMDMLRMIAGKDNVYLQYVDMFIVNQAGYNRLSNMGWIDKTSLGHLALKSTSTDTYIYSPQRYVWQGKLKCCGLKEGSRIRSDGKWECDVRQQLSDIADMPKDGRVIETTIVQNYAFDESYVFKDLEGWLPKKMYGIH